MQLQVTPRGASNKPLQFYSGSFLMRFCLSCKSRFCK